jgi:ribosomal protein L5
MLVGCKVTLRRQNLEDFFDSLTLAMPRMEKYSTLLSKMLQDVESPMLSLSILEMVFFFSIRIRVGYQF